MSPKNVFLAKRIFRDLRWKLAQTCLRLQPNLEVIGIAGSVGKTTAKEIIADILAEQYRVTRTFANLDPNFNLPIAALKTWGSEKFVAELSVDVIGEMDKYLTLVQPRIGVLTRLSLEHTDEEHFGSLEAAVAEEEKLLKFLSKHGWAILNGDDPLIRKVSQSTKALKIFYGFGESNDLRITQFCQKITDSKVNASFVLQYNGSQRAFTTNLLGQQNALCTAAGIAVGIISGISFEKIQKALVNFQPISGRMELKKGKWGVIIDDTYNSSPAAVKAAIDTLLDLGCTDAVVIFGDMLELGQYSQKAHFEIGQYAREKGVKYLATYGEFGPEAIKGFGDEGGNSLRGSNYDEIIKWLEVRQPSTILVKGSRGMRMEKIVEKIALQ